MLQQLAALDILATGRTLTDAAQAVRVSRQTLSEWLNHNEAFQAALAERREERWRESDERLGSLIPKAIETLDDSLGTMQGLQAAVHILKATGLYGATGRAGQKRYDQHSADHPKDDQVETR